jgi:hypothetical protein
MKEESCTELTLFLGEKLNVPYLGRDDSAPAERSTCWYGGSSKEQKDANKGEYWHYSAIFVPLPSPSP